MEEKSIRMYRQQITTTIAPSGRAWLNERKIPASAALARGIKAMQADEDGDIDDIEYLRNNIGKLQANLKTAYAEIERLKSSTGELKADVAELQEAEAGS